MGESPGDAVFAAQREALERARAMFRAKARVILRAAHEDADRISSAIGDVSVDEAWEAWVKKLVEDTQAVS